MPDSWGGGSEDFRGGGGLLPSREPVVDANVNTHTHALLVNRSNIRGQKRTRALHIRRRLCHYYLLFVLMSIVCAEQNRHYNVNAACLNN